MDNKENTKISENKRIFIAAAILVVLLLASCVAILVMRHNSGNCKTATIYVDGEVYRVIDLSKSDDMIFGIPSDENAKNSIEIKNHDIRMNSAECPNNLCVHQGWASETLLPIVCLPNRVVITVTNDNTSSEKEIGYDAITY